ncbi:unnamed protein product [Orchesella dallaii]|uniref:Uncharacterized protein n=1 Tax=Orchesella dallaii TaxID=48710 RepID=A0ABP1QDR5_9HEXA
MSSDFPYYLALFGLTFFLTVICCCVKLIDIIDRPTPRANTMPSWNYANYLQNSPVAILNPHPDPFLRYTMLGENQGLSGEEYLTATTTHAHTTQPGLYPSTSRSAIFSQAQQHRAASAAAASAGSGSGQNSNNDSQASSGNTSVPPAPPAPTPQMPPTPVLYSIHVPEERTRCMRHGGGGELPPKYEEVCFDV